jgi:hypothetical protein
MQDLGKIRYAWIESDPRIPIADPSRLFELKEEGGLYTDIHRMTGLLGLRFAQFWAGCKTGPWQTASTVCHDRNFYSLLSGECRFCRDCALIKTHLSLGLSWNA